MSIGGKSLEERHQEQPCTDGRGVLKLILGTYMYEEGHMKPTQTQRPFSNIILLTAIVLKEVHISAMQITIVDLHIVLNDIFQLSS
jgi:hypothetical protein